MMRIMQFALLLRARNTTHFDFGMNLKGEWVMTEFSLSPAPKCSDVRSDTLRRDWLACWMALSQIYALYTAHIVWLSQPDVLLKRARPGCCPCSLMVCSNVCLSCFMVIGGHCLCRNVCAVLSLLSFLPPVPSGSLCFCRYWFLL